MSQIIQLRPQRVIDQKPEVAGRLFGVVTRIGSWQNGGDGHKAIDYTHRSALPVTVHASVMVDPLAARSKE